MHPAHTAIIAILSAIVGFLLSDRFKGNKEAYPLENEVWAIQREFHLYYLATGEYPKDREFLSQHSKHMIAAYPERFRWDETDVFLHFKPLVPDKFAPSTIGKPGYAFEHNSKVLWAHGNWHHGRRDDYQASDEELRSAGVSLAP